MTVFKTFLKIVNKSKFMIILYTVMLIAFGGINMSSNNTGTSFVATKPNVLIINNDEEVGITKSLVNYIEENSKIIDVKEDEDAINDALFYREVSYIIYIPQNYRNDLLNGLNPQIEIKSAGDYSSSFTEMMLSRYIKMANTYVGKIENEEELVTKIEETIKQEANIEITSKLDTNNLSRAVTYYNFLNYSILAGLVYVICLVLSSFRSEKIRKRTIISSMNYKKHNRELLLSNAVLSIGLWICYVILSIFVIGDIMLSQQGLILILNSFIFSICALCIAFLIANIVSNKNAISGIVNVVGLGSSFLCGAFIPMEWLPDAVLKVAHILPSYWYIKSNELVKTLEEVNIDSLKPIFTNMGVIIGFILVFIILSNIIAKKKRKIG